MAAEVHAGTKGAILRLMRQEHGVRKCARIFLFMDRKQLIELVIDLPEALIVLIAREMAKLKSQIQDMEKACQELKEQLGPLTQVIDLSPPNMEGAALFSFLDGVSGDALGQLHKDIDNETLASVIANAPVEVAAETLAISRSRFQKKQLVEELTRLSKLDAEEAEELAINTRKTLGDAVNEARRNASSSSEIRSLKSLQSRFEFQERKTSKGKGAKEVRKRPTVNATSIEGDATDSLSLDTLLLSADASELQRVIGAVPVDQLATAFIGLSEAAQACLTGNLSSRRRSELEEEVRNCGELHRSEVMSVQRALVKRLSSQLTL